jgi:GTPase
VTALNKVDRLDRPRTVTALDAAARLGVNGEIFPISARTGAGVEPLVEQLVSLLPEGPFLYPPTEQSDQRKEVRLAELVREQVLLRTREELPHAVEVEVDELEERDDGLLVVRARVWAETESQKGILVGAGGRMVKAIGTAARREIEQLLGRRVHLDLHVRVRKGWRRDEALLDRLGIE